MPRKIRLEIFLIACLSFSLVGVLLGGYFWGNLAKHADTSKRVNQVSLIEDPLYPFDDSDWSSIPKFERQKRIRKWCENSIECWRQKNGSIPSKVYLDTVMNPQSNKAAENLFLFWDQKRRQVQLAANFTRKKTLEYNIAYFKSYPVTLKNQLAAKAQQTNRYFSDEIFERYIDKKVKRLEAVLKQETISLKQQIIEYESYDLSPDSMVFEDLIQLLQPSDDRNSLDTYLDDDTAVFIPEYSNLKQRLPLNTKKETP